MKTNAIVLLAVGVLLSVAGCRSLGRLSIERNNREEAQQIKKIISIEPTFEAVTRANGTSTRKYTENSEYEKTFIGMLRDNASRSGIELQVIDAQNLENATALDYFNDLAPLRKETLIANFTQTTKSKWISSSKYFKAPTARFENVPTISSRYSHLAAKYGTPYFAVQGLASVVKPEPLAFPLLLLLPPAGLGKLLNPRAESYYYTIVINVETTEVVYREIRFFHDIANSDNLNTIIYDSFQIMKDK